MLKSVLFTCILLFACHFVNAQNKCGVGIADITGPIADINMMGYAKAGQDASGIHFRLYSRSYVVEDSSGNWVIYSNNDLGMISGAIRDQVIKNLQAKYGNKFSESNVMLAATHTHAGPGGYLPYVLYIVTAQGFNWQNFNAIVSGILRSIERALSTMEECEILFNEGELMGANINRSPTSYDLNPEAERRKYKYNVDKTMSILKFVAKSGRLMGTIAWFPVHSTSMNNTNKLISGDNKGYASMRFEQEMNRGYLPGKGAFVAAFPNANEGDVSPNTKGAKCIDTGAPCDLNSSTCETTVKIPVTMKIGKRSQNINTYTKKSSENCIAFGPGSDMFQSTQIIGEKQYQMAKLLFEKASEKVNGDVSHIHQFIDMSNITLIWNGHQVHTCKSAMGISFAAGTTDGPGAFDFKQGEKKSTPVWNMVRDFIKKPSSQMTKCHHPKPILLATGIMKFPYDWQPQIVPTQIIKIGNVVIVGLPAEFTTMSGRRIRETVAAEIARFDSSKKYHVIISGLTNEYSSYVTTFEEYQGQRYEGASTIYGPHTLEAYRLQYRMLASNLMAKLKIPEGPSPPNLLKKQITLKPGVLFDGSPSGTKFGDVMLDVKPHYYPGNTVFASFISANPRNDLLTEHSFLTVEYLNQKTNQWHVVATDASWETKFFWHRTKLFLGESLATVIWEIPKRTPKGVYRIRIFGVSKNLFQRTTPYVGVTSQFKVMSV